MREEYAITHASRDYVVTIAYREDSSELHTAVQELRYILQQFSLVTMGQARCPESGEAIMRYSLNLDDMVFSDTSRARVIRYIDQARPHVRVTRNGLVGPGPFLVLNDPDPAASPPHRRADDENEPVFAAYIFIYGSHTTSINVPTRDRTRYEDELLTYLQENATWTRVGAATYQTNARHVDTHVAQEIQRLARVATMSRAATAIDWGAPTVSSAGAWLARVEAMSRPAVAIDWGAPAGSSVATRLAQSDGTTLLNWDALFRDSSLAAELPSLSRFARHVLEMPLNTWGMPYTKQIIRGGDHRRNAMVALASGYFAARLWLKYKQPITPEQRVKMRYLWEHIGRVLWDEPNYRPPDFSGEIKDLSDAYHKLWSHDGFRLIVLSDRRPNVYQEMWYKLSEEVRELDNFQRSSDRCFWTHNSLRQEVESSIPVLRQPSVPQPRQILEP